MAVQNGISETALAILVLNITVFPLTIYSIFAAQLLSIRSVSILVLTVLAREYEMLVIPVTSLEYFNPCFNNSYSRIIVNTLI